MSKKTLRLVYAGTFVAICLVLDSFVSFYITESIRISFTPIVIMFAGSLLGPIWGGGIGAVANLLAFLLANKGGGSFHPGFTITIALYGVLAGLLFYKRENNLVKVIFSILLIQSICSLLLNTLWLTQLYGTEFLVQLAIRVPTTMISYVLYVIVMYILLRNKHYVSKTIREEAKAC